MGECDEKVSVKCTLTGEPARIVKELKDRGIVKSVREAIVHGLLAYNDLIAKRDLREAQAKAGLRLHEDS